MSEVNVQISKDLIAPIIEAKIKGALISALGEEKTLIETVVDRIINQKCDYTGKISTYNSDNKHKWIDVVLKQAIHDSTKEVFNEYVAENKNKIKAEMLRQLRTRKGLTQLVNAIFEGVTGSMDTKWLTKVELKFQESKDY